MSRIGISWIVVAGLGLANGCGFTGGANVEPPAYAATGITGAAFAWDSGDDDLPGSRQGRDLWYSPS